MPVSYTHLDVYKRQVQTHYAYQGYRILNGMQGKDVLNPMPEKDLIYTGDVYKRQVPVLVCLSLSSVYRVLTLLLTTALLYYLMLNLQRTGIQKESVLCLH